MVTLASRTRRKGANCRSWFRPPRALESLSYYPGSSVKGRTGGLGLKASQTEKGFGSDSATLSSVARPWSHAVSEFLVVAPGACKPQTKVGPPLAECVPNFFLTITGSMALEPLSPTVNLAF